MRNRQMVPQHNIPYHINTAGTKLFVYRKITDMEPSAIFDKEPKRGGWIRDGRYYGIVAEALDSLDNPRAGRLMRKPEVKTTGPRSTFSEEDKTTVVRMYNEGVPVSTIAKTVGKTKPSVQTWIGRHRKLCPTRKNSK